MDDFSDIVAAGMAKVCGDFHEIVKAQGFTRRGRVWRRKTGDRVDVIRIERKGASYGAPINASIDLRLTLHQEDATNGHKPMRGPVSSTLKRRSTGYCYHHRFNAQTGSTYERCVEELGLFLTEFALPWFRNEIDDA